MHSGPKRILVLCRGNSSRSQMAEAYLRFFVGNSHELFSAGLESHGINPLTVEVMAEDKIEIDQYRSKSYHEFEEQHFDYLISVCDQIIDQIPESLHFSHQIHFSIPDPTLFEGTPQQKLDHFREVREIVKENILLFIGKELLPKEQSLIV